MFVVHNCDLIQVLYMMYKSVTVHNCAQFYIGKERAVNVLMYTVYLVFSVFVYEWKMCHATVTAYYVLNYWDTVEIIFSSYFCIILIKFDFRKI